jgi:hypothetical protein
MPLYTFLHNLLNVLVHIAVKIGLQKNRCRWEPFTVPLPSNDRLLWLHFSGLQPWCHIHPSFQLYFPSSLQVHRQFFSSEGAWLWRS